MSAKKVAKKKTAKKTAKKKTAKKTAEKKVGASGRRSRKSTASKKAPRKRGAERPRKASGSAPRKVLKRRKKPETLRLRSVAAGLTVADLQRSIDFYTRALGFVEEQRWEREGVLLGVMLRAGRCELGLSQDDWAKGRERKKGQGVRFWFETAQDLDALAARIRANSDAVTAGPELQSWGGRALNLDDPDGFHLTFTQASG